MGPYKEIQPYWGPNLLRPVYIGVMGPYKEKQPYWGPNLLRPMYIRCDLPKFRWAEFMARIEEKIDIQGYYKRNRHFQRYVVSKPLPQWSHNLRSSAEER